MTKPNSAGAAFRLALTEEQPLQIVGTLNAYTALLAQKVGFRAIYLSGGGVAYGSYGLPDLGITDLHDVLEDARRITAAVPDLPLLVDVDTGWGHAFGIARTVKEMIRAGVAAIHMEDQVAAKRCGHRPGKALVSATEMEDRLKAAVDARTDASFVIMARTDAAAVEGLDVAIERAQRYVAVGADMIFAEALESLDQFQQFVQAVKVPVLANMTEFGKTPLFTVKQFAGTGVQVILYPLTAFRAMAAAALSVYTGLREQGTQAALLDKMQTRDSLYEVLHYHTYEATLDRLFARGEKE